MKQVALVSGDIGAHLGGEEFRLGPLPGAARDGPGAVTVDVLHDDPVVRGRFGRRGPLTFDAAILGRDVTAAVVRLGSPAPVAVFEVEEHTGWLADPERRESRIAAPDLVKQVSFLYPGAGVTATEFREHYRHHIDVARRYMPSLWQYVQNDVTAVLPADGAGAGIVAISELWFTVGDFLDRYFPSAEDEAAFRSHEGFLDLSRAFSFIAREWHTEGAG